MYPRPFRPSDLSIAVVSGVLAWFLTLAIRAAIGN
jgi:hypothetical protein